MVCLLACLLCLAAAVSLKLRPRLPQLPLFSLLLPPHPLLLLLLQLLLPTLLLPQRLPQQQLLLLQQLLLRPSPPLLSATASPVALRGWVLPRPQTPGMRLRCATRAC